MDLTALLYFVPLGVGAAWLFNLIFRQNLAKEPIGKIISYFIGVLIIVVVVGWMMDSFLPTWVYQRIVGARTSSEWRQVIDSSTLILDQSFTPGGDADTVVIAPTRPSEIINIVPTAIPGTNPADVNPNTSGGPVQHVVVSGDTLTTLATKYGTTVNDIMLANGMSSDIIYAGQTLLIPAGTAPTNP